MRGGDGVCQGCITAGIFRKGKNIMTDRDMFINKANMFLCTFREFNGLKEKNIDAYSALEKAIDEFSSFANIPLLDAIILINTSLLFSILLSRLFLKEKNPIGVYIIIPLVLTGVMFIIKPFGYSSFSAVALLGLLAALFAAGAGICIRYLGQRYHTYEIIFYFMVTATAVSIPLMAGEFVMPRQQEWFYLVCIGIVSLIAQLFLTKAFTHENAVVVELVRYIGITFNAFWGFIFWTEIPDVFSLIGTVLIITGCIVITRIKSKKKEKNNG